MILESSHATDCDEFVYFSMTYFHPTAHKEIIQITKKLTGMLISARFFSKFHFVKLTLNL